MCAKFSKIIFIKIKLYSVSVIRNERKSTFGVSHASDLPWGTHTLNFRTVYTYINTCE